MEETTKNGEGRGTLREIAKEFLRLGFVAYGGPAAHVAMMEERCVRRREWLTRERFLDLLGAASLLPGPSSNDGSGSGFASMLLSLPAVKQRQAGIPQMDLRSWGADASPSVFIGGQLGYPKGLMFANKHNFAPRVGIAKNLPKSGLLIRAAYGVFFTPVDLNTWCNQRHNVPYVFPETQQADNFTPPAALFKLG